MTDYILSLVSASIAVSLLSILAPDASGIAKHVRLIASLFLICVLISPIGTFLGGLRALANGEVTLPEWSLPSEEETEKQFQAALNTASKAYFLDSLTQLLASEFSLQAGDIRCTANWSDEGDTPTPTKITVLLSGKAIWKNPTEIEAFVRDLLDCECITAIE